MTPVHLNFSSVRLRLGVYVGDLHDVHDVHAHVHVHAYALIKHMHVHVMCMHLSECVCAKRLRNCISICIRIYCVGV